MCVSSNGFHLTSDQIARLANLAQQAGKSLPDVFDDAIAAYHPQRASQPVMSDESFFDAASRLVFVGCIKDTPVDLSTNKRHMEGFGQRES
jgi:hypothetical protein